MRCTIGWTTIALVIAAFRLEATPVNRAALARHYDRYLAPSLNRCTTCHLPSPNQDPQSLEEFPHNPFGHRLRLLGEELTKAGGKRNLAERVTRVAAEDSDADGAPNEIELLLGHNPGDPQDAPTPEELQTQAGVKRREFAAFMQSYRWRPFEPVKRPAPPTTEGTAWARNPIDLFVTAEREKRGLHPRPEAPKSVLLRRVYLDLIGLSPTPEELAAFENDAAPGAYERVVDRLLEDPRYGERWGRHWMDVWRYSDWAGWSGGNQIRDSKPHVWRWRDWIIESLNQDKPYDRMIVEMLAGDEVAPEDPETLRATGFLVRNFKLLSREQWLEDTIKHTSQAFLGLTVGCAKCHDHMSDPISQVEYYQLRAIFEPHHVRTDRLPGELDTLKKGLVRAYDSNTNALTYFFNRGDERKADTNRVLTPGVPQFLGGEFRPGPVRLPRLAHLPDRREFVIRDMIEASSNKVATADRALEKARLDTGVGADKRQERELESVIARLHHEALLASLNAERLEDSGQRESSRWTNAALKASGLQREVSVAEAKLKLLAARAAEAKAEAKVSETSRTSNEAPADADASGTADLAKKRAEAAEKAAKELDAARKKRTEAETALAAAEKELETPLSTQFKPRSTEVYPELSTGRRLAFARWIAHASNPLTARVAMNHIWLRHFGRGIVPTPADFGASGRPPTHPELLDWLAAELMAQRWRMKPLHRLIVTSSTYRMASTPDAANERIDADNVFLWRMPSRRMEAEIIRDNLLYVSGNLDATFGGPDIDHTLGLKSARRSVYLRIAAEKEVEFLKVFDGPSVTECYERRASVMPQQALALANSELAVAQARRFARALSQPADRFGSNAASDESFIRRAFLHILARPATQAEVELCLKFLDDRARKTRQAGASGELIPVAQAPIDNAEPGLRARENLVLVLFNHNDFVTIR